MSGDDLFRSGNAGYRAKSVMGESIDWVSKGKSKGRDIQCKPCVLSIVGVYRSGASGEDFPSVDASTRCEVRARERECDIKWRDHTLRHAEALYNKIQPCVLRDAESRGNLEERRVYAFLVTGNAFTGRGEGRREAEVQQTKQVLGSIKELSSYHTLLIFGIFGGIWKILHGLLVKVIGGLGI